MVVQNQLEALLPYLYYGVWPAILLWESLQPARPLKYPLAARWSGNFSLLIINTLMMKLLVFLVGMHVLNWAYTHGLRLLDQPALPILPVILLGLLLNDLSQYGFHIISHKIHWLWRLHRVHHNDAEIDVSTNFRHHPLETLASLIFAGGVALILGFPPLAIIISQLLSQIIEPLSHGNIHLPEKLDKFLRFLLVTPAMHLVHHSADKRETDSNYGVLFSIWDRMFGTYVAKPALGEENMVIGLEDFREPAYARLPGSLALPFVSRT
jgi:sterol desaturase/sphingolipid hydroxylase (fatty acid hydroxylase superfamily)